MTSLPEWFEPGPEVVHLMRARGPFAVTECCRQLRHDVPYGDKVTSDPELVTCEVSWHEPLMNSIVARRAALDKRVEEAFPRLLGVRDQLNRASSSAIDDEFRNQLLKLIDGGNDGNNVLRAGGSDGDLRGRGGSRLAPDQLPPGRSAEEGHA